MEEIKINNELDKECLLYHNDKFLGVIRNDTALNDVLVQIRLRWKDGIDVSGYYVIFNDKKVPIEPHGRITNPPHGFFRTNAENLRLLFTK